jgi:hypothetical protein
LHKHERYKIMTLVIYLDGPVSLRRISPELNHQLFHKVSPGVTVGRLTEVVSGLHGLEGDPLQSAIEPERLPDARVPAIGACFFTRAIYLAKVNILRAE